MNLLGLIEQAVHFLSNFAHTLIPSLIAAGHYVVVSLFREYIGFVWGLISALPIPASLLYPTLPDPGPLGYALTALGIPSAFAIISSAFTIKLLLRLIPFIGR